MKTTCKTYPFASISTNIVGHFVQVLCACALLGLASVTGAQTIISGPNISGTWSPSGNPYIVSGNVTVPSGQSLTIQPGTVIWIGSGVSITNNGLIQAVGTPNQRIEFQAPVSSQYWGTILNNYAGKTNLYTYCDFQNATNALTLSVIAPTDDNVTMVTMSSEILNCTFSNCVGNAIYGDSSGTTWGDYANHSADARLNSVVKNCYFERVGYGCRFYIYGTYRYGYIGRGYASPQIINNIFENVASNAVSFMAGSYAGNSQGNVINNTFVNCVHGFGANDPWDATVENNVFVGCTFAVWDTGTFSRTVSYNDFHGNATNFTGYGSTYGEWIIPNRNGTLADVLYNISQDPLFGSTNDFHLQTNSPCIDAGTPDWAWSDMCFPPSQGTSYPDLGAYGGPDACNWLTNVPMLATSPWMSQSNGVVSINWGALPRSTYEIQYTTNILDTNWTSLSDVTAVEKPTSQTITATNHQEYYRIQSLGRTPGN